MSLVPLSAINTPAGGAFINGDGFVVSSQSSVKYADPSRLFKIMGANFTNSNGTGLLRFSNFDSNWTQVSNVNNVAVPVQGVYDILLKTQGGGFTGNANPAGYVDLIIRVNGVDSTTNRYNIAGFSSYNGAFQCVTTVKIDNPTNQYISCELAAGNYSSGTFNSPSVTISRKFST